jgi:hypothetical protein
VPLHVFYNFSGGCWRRFTQISHVVNELGNRTISHMISDLESLIASIKNRIWCRTAVEHLATRTMLRQIYQAMESSTWATYQLLRSLQAASYSHCRSPSPWSSMRQSEWSEMNLEMDSDHGLRKGHRHGVDIQTWNAVWNAIGKYIDYARLFWIHPWCLIGSSCHLFTVNCLHWTWLASRRSVELIGSKDITMARTMM